MDKHKSMYITFEYLYLPYKKYTSFIFFRLIFLMICVLQLFIYTDFYSSNVQIRFLYSFFFGYQLIMLYFVKTMWQLQQNQWFFNWQFVDAIKKKSILVAMFFSRT